MIDSEGFRANVGIILTNNDGQVFWARRMGMDAWQFPQGGIKKNESPKTAMYRELKEEIGLKREHVEILNSTKDWLRYSLHKQYIRKNREPLCIGQKQKWYIMKFNGNDSEINIKTKKPEFLAWKWIDLNAITEVVVDFKLEVYRKIKKEVEKIINK